MQKTVSIPRDDRPSLAAKLRRIGRRLPTYVAYTRQRPGWLLLLVFGRLLVARRLERWLRRAAPRLQVPAATSRLAVDDIEQVIPALVRDGAYGGLQLAAADRDEILAFAQTNPCFPRDGLAGFLPDTIAAINAARTRDLIAAYYFETVVQCPAIERLRVDPLLHAIASAYLGESVQQIRTRLWWSFPGTRINDADLHDAAQDRFHFDMNDWRTLKFFFYLTPADAGSGAHKYVAGSHRRRAARHQWTMMVGHPEADIAAAYGSDAIRTVIGAAGQGFAEDPFVFHTGTLCRAAPRLLLELEYGPWAPSPSYRYGVLG